MSFEYENLENLNIQLIDGDRGKNYPKQSEFQESGYCLFLSAKNVTKSGFQFSEKVYVSEERHNLLRAGKLERYDIVLTTRGTIGNVAFYDNSVLDDVVRVNSGMLILRANTTVWNPRFLYFLFTSKIIQEQISSLTSGSAVPQLPAKDLRKFLLPKVPMGVQNYIVKVIGDLSDKLKINDQTNQTLEEMAQAIFKSWFVDFDPVKAKMNGEQPEGMDAATASLFPEKLVESELGLIPDGWEVKQLKDILELAYGKALKKTDRVEGDVPVYGSGGLTGYHNQSLVEGPGIIVGRKGTVGSVYWEPKAFYPIDTVFYVKPKAGYSLNYCYLILQNLGLKNMNTDAAVPGLNRNNAYRLEVVTPSQGVLNKFESLMSAFQSKIDGNNAENSSLETLRDTLLPKLLSGEIELGQAQELAEVE
ncbi:restriction endonuclease subunit S [Vibrio parahaemolyticus]|nr:restriction endonuclease subunit S [Vibrio parahaemolyticus]